LKRLQGVGRDRLGSGKKVGGCGVLRDRSQEGGASWGKMASFMRRDRDQLKIAKRRIDVLDRYLPIGERGS